MAEPQTRQGAFRTFSGVMGCEATRASSGASASSIAFITAIGHAAVGQRAVLVAQAFFEQHAAEPLADREIPEHYCAV